MGVLVSHCGNIFRFERLAWLGMEFGSVFWDTIAFGVWCLVIDGMEWTGYPSIGCIDTH